MQHRLLLALCLGLPALPGHGQIQISGRITHPRWEGGEPLYLATIVCFASKTGEGAEARSFRSWETDPAGWYRITGDEGNYTLMFTQPAHYFRPLVRFNLHARHGEKLDRVGISPQFDYGCFYEGGWDNRPASDYFQPFVAKGKSVTSVGFRFAHDGVDGAGPGGQNVVVSIHRRGEGAPTDWPQIGPTGLVINVDCGGAKNYAYSAGWNSGEVPLTPGETYYVRLRAEKAGNGFQTFWQPAPERAGCYRIGKDGSAGWQTNRLWLAVGTDCNGLVIPYQKRVHQQFKEFAGFSSKWSQTYVAQGRSLASVILYAATGGAQPGISRQRAVVRVRQGGATGPVIGVQKIAIGNGNYTGDASWGMFGAAYAPGEVPLTPGETYAVELESIENYETLHGFVNIKGDISDDRPGFNPYRKVAPDTYAQGAAFKQGKDQVEFDLDLQIIEYESPALPAPGPNLLANGDMQTTAGELPAGWRTFAIHPDTQFRHFADGPQNTNRTARVLGGSATGKAADGGFVQAVTNLNRFETYLLAGKLRSSWPVDLEHQCWIGFDPTGQTDSPQAATIQWKMLPGKHGLWEDYRSEPIRPAAETISVWLRARTTLTGDYRFTADFDDLSLRKVATRPE